MGQTESQSNIQQQYDIVKLREDGTALLHHKRTQDQFMLRTVSSNIHQEIVLFQDMLKKRQHVRSSHLLDLVQIRRKQQKNVCSVVHKLYLLIEFPFKTLKDEMMDKICHTKVVPFLQAQLWSILYSCCQGLNSLYCKKMPHQSLTSNQIYISREGIIKIADPILLGLQKNYIKVLKNSDQHVQISPEIINFLDDCNFSFYDKQKSDVFILGVIMLEASLLRPIQLFDQKTKKPYLQIINSGLKQVREKYSQSYCNLIQMMLQLHSKLRPRFQDLITLIEHDTNLYESTDEASVQHRTQTSQQFINSKNYKSQKTLPRPCHVKNQGIQNSVSSKNRTMNRSDSANNMHSIKPYVQHGQYETIIKMLQTENIVKANNDNRTYIPPPGFQPVTYPIPSQINQSALQQSKQHPYIHNLGHQQAHNIPQMHRFNNMQQVHNNFNQNNPTAFYQHPNKQQSNSQPISPQPANSQPPSARFLDVNQRFSYTKFGNITLPNQPPNQQLNTQPSVQPNHKPIYSYQIPQINQLLKNSKVNSSFATTLPKSKNFSNNLQSNEMNLEPMRKQPSPKQIASNEGTVISLKRINQEKQKKIPIINHDNKNQMVENAELDRIEIISSWTDQSNLVDLKNKQVKVASQTGYQISNGPRISLNGLLKQNSGKKNEIYAVTQKTEENMDTSPGRTNFKVQSALKLNQPQRSPGYQNSRIASSSKQQSQTNLQNEPKYVVLILDGGGRYEGFLKNGMKNGDGKLQFNDGGYYVGQWKDNKMHGVGKLHYQNGQIAYEGDWDNDQFCGFGRVFNDRPEKLIGQFNYYDFADLGQKWIYYQGEFKNDSKHGKGKIRLTNGQVFEGNFVFDSIEGEGIFYTSRGQAIKGCWRDNMLIQS